MATDSKIAKEAAADRDKGIDSLKTCALLFKCKPNYDEAIPYFKNAASGFKSIKNPKEEIFCRLQLVECFKKTDSLWEEGNEHERIAYIQFIDLKDHKNGYNSIINAHRAYYEKGDYQESSNCIFKLAILLRQDSNFNEYCEKLLKVSFDSLLKYSHVLLSKGDEQTDFIYKTFKFFTATLVQNDKTRIAIESSDLLIKSIKNFEKDKSALLEVYICKLVCMIINETDFNDINLVISECEGFVEDRSDIIKLGSVKKLKSAIDSGNEKEFNDNIYEVGSGLDNELVKKLKSSLNKTQAGKKSREVENKSQNEDPENFL